MSDYKRSTSKPIVIEFPLYIKTLKLSLFMRMGEVEDLTKTLKVNLPKSILYLQLVRSYQDTVNLSDGARKALSLPITRDNLRQIKDCLSEALQWFDLSNRKELYGEINGVTVLNADYSKLQASFIDKEGSLPSALMIKPGVMEVGVNVVTPAVVIYINNKDNHLVLSEYHFRKLANAILDFSFLGYEDFAMNCLEHSIRTGSFITEAEVQERLAISRKFNSNL